MIIARRLTIIQKNGMRFDFTHIEEITTLDNTLFIKGETDDVANGRVKTHDRFPIEHLEHMYVDWYIPKV